MKSLIYLVLVYIQAATAIVDVFKFGVDHGVVVFSHSGNIGVLEKHVEIPIVLPVCMDLSFVRVDVDNHWAPPKVDFESDVNIVHIHYRPLQISTSTYTVIAKGVPTSNC